MILRKYTPEDCPALLQLFSDTVHTINCADYSPQQLAAWTGGVDAGKWADTLRQNFTLVAEVNGTIAGFADLDGETLDRLYIHKDFQRQGIAKNLVLALEEKAKQGGATRVTTHASITAKPFFEKLGYVTIAPQTVERNGVLLNNFLMRKIL